MAKETIYWYAAKVRYQTEKKVKVWLEEKEIDHFIPFHTVVVEKEGRKVRKEKPQVSGFVFIHTNYQTALSLLEELKIKILYLKNLETKKFLIVPDKQMQDFMFLLDFSDTTLRIANTNLKRGDRVRVIKGEFAGIEGELIRIKGHKRVVVRMEGLFSIATAYIPGDYLERI